MKNITKERIVDILLYAGVGPDNYEMVKPAIIRANRIAVKALSTAAAILIAVMLIGAFRMQGIRSNQIVYLVGLIITGAMAICSIKLDRASLVRPMVYLCYSVFYLYGIMIGTITDPGEKTVTFMVMLVLMPMVFVDRPLHVFFVSSAYIALFIGLCLHTKTGNALENDIIDAIVFGMLGMTTGVLSDYIKIHGYVDQIRLKEICLKLRDKSRVDALTDMQNRNAYEADFCKVAKRCEESLGCIYIDVNGLKDLNDTLGHEEGDKMLKVVADCVKKYFGEEFSYRVGGDEFVSFVIDPKSYGIKDMVDDFLAEIHNWDYYASVGWKIHKLDTLSMKDLIAGAESEMYKKKVDFYKQVGFDRRSSHNHTND